MLTIGLLYLSWLDFKTKLLSTLVLFALSIAAITILALGSPIGLSWKNAFIGLFLNGFIFWLIRYIFSKIKQKEAMGQGDIILVAVGGLWVGPWALPYIMALAGISSLVVLGTYYLIKKNKARSKSRDTIRTWPLLWYLFILPWSYARLPKLPNIKSRNN